MDIKFAGSTIKQWLLPLLVLGTGILAGAAVINAKPEVAEKQPVIKPKSVEAVVAVAQPEQLTIRTQGSVQAKETVEIIPRVAGEITYVSGKFVNGGLFERGEILVKLDPRDYELALITAQAGVAEGIQHLEMEKANAKVATAEWRLAGAGDASELALRKPQLAGAQAKLKSAQAALKRAELNLERTIIRAPFNGLLSNRSVSIGQYLTAGRVIGIFSSTDQLEVRLPLSNRHLAQLDLEKLHYSTLDVVMRGQFADRVSQWRGKIVRTEGAINAKTRSLFVVAQVSGDQLWSEDGRSRLRQGQFVSAEIEGRFLAEVISLPRAALRNGDRVVVIDETNRLRSKKVETISISEDRVLVVSGVAKGDTVCISPLMQASEGARVTVVGSPEQRS